jgi:hypothetical protein
MKTAFIALAAVLMLGTVALGASSLIAPADAPACCLQKEACCPGGSCCPKGEHAPGAHCALRR